MPAKNSDVEDRIVDASSADPYVKALVYGRNGTGKTRFAASAPAVLIIDANERGTRSVAMTEAKVFHAQTWEDIGKAFWYLKSRDHSFKSVALDTLTQMQALCMVHVLREETDRDPLKDPTMPTQRDYGKLAELMKSQLLSFRNLDMHVIFTAQDRLEGNADEGETLRHVPGLTPASRDTAMGCVDVIGYLYQREVKAKNPKQRSSWQTRMLVGPHDEYETKDRTGKLGRIVRQPSMQTVLTAALGKEK